MDWNSRQIRNITNEKTKDHLWQLDVWTRDGKYLIASRMNAGFDDSSIYRIDVASGQTEELTPHQGKTLFFAGGVSPDGKTIVVTSNQKGGYQNVALLDVASKQLKWITDTQWEAQGGEFSPNGKLVTWVLNADGVTTTNLYNVSSGKSEAIAMPQGLTSPDGTPSAFSPDGKYLLLGFQNSQRPSDFWVYDVGTRRARQVTYSAVAGLTPSSIPEAQLVHYKSVDGKMISAFLWVPFNLKRDGSNPAVVLPHGGPRARRSTTSTPRPRRSPSRGYICIAPNVRGSTGYGMEFQKANYQDLGGGDLQDEVYATKFLVDTGYVDAKKIGITGGSYGGFMTLMAVGKTPDVWAAAVEEYGIINWYTMLQHEDPFLQQYEQTLLGDPEKDRAIYEADSPIKYIGQEKAPLLVLQGTNDIRVPKEEAEQVVEILKKNGRTVDAHYYEAEGHGFSKRENQIDSLRRTVDWFNKYLKGESASRRPERNDQPLSPKDRVFVLTGAGISAESGLPTFRGAEGIWRGQRAQDVATPEAFRANPEMVWQFYSERRKRHSTVLANPAHFALAALERALEERFFLCTQNVDSLHEQAGSSASFTCTAA